MASIISILQTMTLIKPSLPIILFLLHSNKIKYYTSKEIEEADKARELRKEIVWIITPDLKKNRIQELNPTL